jgi:hypothetical protein
MEDVWKGGYFRNWKISITNWYSFLYSIKFLDTSFFILFFKLELFIYLFINWCLYAWKMCGREGISEIGRLVSQIGTIFCIQLNSWTLHIFFTFLLEFKKLKIKNSLLQFFTPFTIISLCLLIFYSFISP